MRALITDQEYIECGDGNFIPYIFAHIWKDKMQVIGIIETFEDSNAQWLNDRQKNMMNNCDVFMHAREYLEYTCRLCRNKGGSKKLTFMPWVSHCRENDINGLYRMDQLYNKNNPFFKSHPVIDPCDCNPLWNGIPQVCSMKVIQNLAPNFFNLPYKDNEEYGRSNFVPIQSFINDRGPITRKQFRYIKDMEKKKGVSPTVKNLDEFSTAQASQYIRYLKNMNSGPSTLQSLMRRITPLHSQTHDPLDDAEDLVTVLEHASKLDMFNIPTTNYF
jgi:hypothetical protein